MTTTAAPQAVTRHTDNAMPNRTATLTMQGWEALARSLFGWRTRAGYATWHGRIQALGSHDYDRLVIAAADKENAR